MDPLPLLNSRMLNVFILNRNQLMMPEIYLRMDSAEDCGYLTAFCNALDYAELKKGKKKLMSAPFCIITARDHVTGVMYVLVSNTFYNRAL